VDVAVPQQATVSGGMLSLKKSIKKKKLHMKHARLKMLKASNNDYGVIAKAFHWMFAVVILWQFFTGLNLHNMEFSPEKGQFIWFHQITGTLIFCLISLRLIWRFYNRPKFEDTLPKIHKISSKIVQFILYVLCIWLPVQGALMTWAGGYDVYLIGLVKVPALVAVNKEMYPTFVDFHYVTSLTLLMLTLLHISAGLYHRYFRNDEYGVWKRMAVQFRKSQDHTE
jgi:cytochrome b561